MQLLLDARTEKDEQVWWNADETGVYASGASASVETTGLAVQALLKWGEASGTARKAMSYIAVEERRGRNMGHNPSDHHGAAGFAPRHGKRCGRCARHGGGHCSTASPSKSLC